MSEGPEQNAIATRCQELATILTRHTDGLGNGNHPTAITNLEFLRNATSTAICTVYEPAFAIIVQGKKDLLLGEEPYSYGVAQYLVVSVALPVRGFVVEASPDKPYLGFLLKLSPLQLCDLVTQIPPMTQPTETSIRGLFISAVDVPLIDCALRLAQLLDTPQDIPFLAPMIIREIYYRLLTGEQSEAVRQIATSGSQMQRIADVIQQIQTEFKEPMRVEDLAEQVNMSPASFHRHFKDVTSMSPLQYQKQIRLLEARRLLLIQDLDATHAAYQVGYESPSQFSREYSRMFGLPPMRDIERLRTA